MLFLVLSFLLFVYPCALLFLYPLFFLCFRLYFYCLCWSLCIIFFSVLYASCCSSLFVLLSYWSPPFLKSFVLYVFPTLVGSSLLDFHLCLLTNLSILFFNLTPILISYVAPLLLCIALSIIFYGS